MHLDDPGTTDSSLLGRLGNWRDRRAWGDFVGLYDPWIRSCCHRFRLDAESTDELCQVVWVELAGRMRSFTYDPGKAFRGWLRQLCRSRAIDWLRKKDLHPAGSLDDLPDDLFAGCNPPGEGEGEAERPELLRRAEEIQARVRRKVDERTWRVFWGIAIERLSVREAADAEGLTYYAAFAARKRVARMLREEGARSLASGEP
ncbi:MAG: sigma-70 family RNA polymerase sigma factor [Isosphaeraceae bacterium]